MNWNEKAYERLGMHREWAVLMQHCIRIILFLNYTDPFNKLLHYTPLLRRLVLRGTWKQYSTAEKRRMHTLHQAIAQINSQLENTVIRLMH